MAKKYLFNKICIVGVGLIGGSIGLAVKKRRLAKLVVGVVRRKASAIQAVECQAVDVATLDLGEGVRGADLVILCAPVSTIIRQMPLIRPHLAKDAVVIDVGSSKVEIEKAARSYFPRFIGCHPMAGSERTGVCAADAGLFEDSVCFISKADPKVERLWKALGSKPIVIAADKHDRAAALLSHLPHAAAFSIFQILRSLPVKGMPLNPSARAIARLAKSDAAIWTDIFTTNKAPLRQAIRAFIGELNKLDRSMAKGDAAAIGRFIAAANKNASNLLG